MSPENKKTIMKLIKKVLFSKKKKQTTGSKNVTFADDMKKKVFTVSVSKLKMFVKKLVANYEKK